MNTALANVSSSYLMQSGVLGACVFSADGRVHELMGQAEWAPQPGGWLQDAPLFVGLDEALSRVAQDGAPLHLPAVRIGARGCDFRVLRLPNSPHLAVISTDADERLDLLRAAKQTERRQRILDEHAWIERDQHRAARADLLNRFIERAPAAIAVIDRDLTEVVASERWRALYALQDKGARAQACDEACGAFSHAERAQFLQMSIDNGVPTSRVEKTIRNGAPVWTRWDQIPWREADGQIAGAFVYSEDVTETMLKLSRIEAEIARLRKSEADLRALIRGAVNRLRAPLKGAALPQCESQRDGLSLDQVRALRNVAQALAQFESLSAPALAPAHPPVDLSELVESAALELAQEIAQAGAQLAIGPMLAVRGDRALLSRMFREIIGNALAHGGQAPHIVIDCIEDDSGIVVRVTDDGIGLPAPLRAHALDFFQRIDGGSGLGLGSGCGAGMGLPECRRIMELHGGVLALDPDWDAGLRVVLTFPRSNSAAPDSPASGRFVGFP